MALAALIVLGAYAGYAAARDRVLAGRAAEVEAVAELQLSEITAWRAERLADARVIARDPLLAGAVRAWLAQGGPVNESAPLQARLDALRDECGYERVSLLDAQGAVRLTTPPTSLNRIESDELARQARGAAEVAFVDLHRDDTGRVIHLELVVPLRSRNGGPEELVGFVEILIDAERSLFRLIRSWPTPCDTAETLLLRRDGPLVTYLNEPRHRKGGPLSLQLPVGLSDLSRTAEETGHGIVDTRDYRGERVLAAMRAIPGSPWVLVAKMDRDGVIAPLVREAWLIACLAVALIALAGLITERLGRREQELCDEALRQSDHRYRALFENSITGVAVHQIVRNEEGRAVDYLFLDVNPAFEALTGLRREDVVGRRVTSVLPGIESDPFIEVYGQVAATGQGIRFEQGATPLGRRYDVAAFRVGDGCFATVFNDVSERQRAEELIHLQAAALDAAANAVMITDREGRIVWANSAFTQLTGWTLHECLGQTPRILKSGHHPQQLYGEVWRTILDGRVWQHEMTNLRKDGQAYVEDQTITPVRDSRGEITHFVAIKIDVAERKRAEAALRESEARYRTLFANSPAAFYRSTEDGRILECNDAFVRIMGWASREEAMAGNAEDLYPTPSSRAVFLEQLRAQGSLVNIEVEARRRDGRPVWLLENVHLTGETPDGSRVLEGTFVDITERRLLEEELRQSQKLQGIGRLAGGVAHDFNNILGVIIGYGGLALRQVGTEHPAAARLEQILRAAERAADLTRQLLAFSRKQVLRPELVNLNTLVAEAEKMLGRLIGEDIALVFRCGHDLGIVRADPGQIGQIIMNLAVNGRDAMPRGGVLVVETTNVEVDTEYAAAHPPMAPGGYVMLSITDTGVGISPDVQAHVFEPFFTTKGQGQGTGLGLATVYGIVKQSGGFIWLTSELGHGTTFEVYLPRVEGAVEEPAPIGAPIAPAGHETILLAEDSEALRDAVRAMLEERGYRVFSAADGEEALAISRRPKQSIDLLLTDVVMPRLGGADLAALVVADHPMVRVLYMSGYTDGAISRQGVLRTGARLLEKPFTAARLARAVREALDRPIDT